ncbi:aminotransferase class I/II-fold pyridoxal phosphate-dependent enzyme [Paenibacillus sp. PK4536]|uniref:aminotransferase class I/II-fold pyridoxal phosphate-dependent enzyme n=1 Tax=Paenibacillus sp. PK4536 TaxID=3024576 RepID=UPI00235A3CEC|nr:aminotransferase class I/II-fold pyridoxal phosphate-dependent enzyme [Paenibacillus sp. PK4536]WIM38657.1 aminotransferase class I/II-fold pyridoxal phosphate-dependent enzyme [Paenibacillus sp. PK4536]
MTTSTINQFLTPSIQQMQPSGIRKFFDYSSERTDIISLGIGEPDFPTPRLVREACVRALEEGRTTYTHNAGLPELRESIAEYLYTNFQVHYNPAHELMVTIGSSEALDLALRVLINEGDEILVPAPCYVSYSPITNLGGGVAVEVETFAHNNFKLTPDSLLASLTPRSKVLILSYPSNPTGGIMTYEDWLPIAKIAEEHNLVVITDEVYAELTYGQKHVSFASLPGMKERTLLLSGFSKAFAMTGWRIGYACGPEELIQAMLKIHQYTVMCAPILGQIAALESLKPHGLAAKDEMMASYNARRISFVQGLRQIGLQCHEPLGSFFAFPSIAHTGLTSEQFAQRLLQEVGVLAVPGTAFGKGGEGFIRCSYATSSVQLDEALERMRQFLQTL